MKAITKYLQQKANIIEERLQKYLDLAVPQPQLLEAIRYALLGGGKRIRPIFSLAVTELLDGYVSQIIPTACAIEMIHVYSLIHDDLPAMDNDDLRRGKPTVHKKYDEATAILAGDVLQTYAYEILARGSETEGVEPRVIVKLIKELGKACGLNGMAGGQMLDLVSAQKKISLDILQQMHCLKTGALLQFSIMAPTYICETDRITRETLTQYAQSIGLAFQIKDDILDVEGKSSELGKTAGKDVSSGKSTYVTLLGLAKAKDYLVAETKKAYNAAKFFGADNALQGLAEYLLERKN